MYLCFCPCPDLETAIVLSPWGNNLSNMASAFSTSGGKLTTVVLPDTSKVTNMRAMFANNWSSFECPVFNTSSVTNISNMFASCAQLKEIPNLTFGRVTNANYAFDRTYNVNTGILRVYNNLISQTTPPSNHECTFKECGIHSETGAIEVAQIPSDWKDPNPVPEDE